MNEFKTILTKLKEIIRQQLQTDKKVLDKDVAAALNIKASALASFKRRDKPPYQAILCFCEAHHVDAGKVLNGVDEPITNYPAPVEDGKARVKYFRSLKVYAVYLSGLKPSPLL